MTGSYWSCVAKLCAWLIGMTLILTFIFTYTADARPLHQGRHHAARQHAYRSHSHRQSVRPDVPSVQSDRGSGGGSSLVAEARRQIGNGAIYGRASLWCARFVNYVLAKTGHSGTNSDTAASFARYGTKVNGPQVGAIAVMSRRGGGHVGIVSGVDAEGNPILISGNNRRAVRESAYPRQRIYAYVLPN